MLLCNLALFSNCSDVIDILSVCDDYQNVELRCSVVSEGVYASAIPLDVERIEFETRFQSSQLNACNMPHLNYFKFPFSAYDKFDNACDHLIGIKQKVTVLITGVPTLGTVQTECMLVRLIASTCAVVVERLIL